MPKLPIPKSAQAENLCLLMCMYDNAVYLLLVEDVGATDDSQD